MTSAADPTREELSRKYPGWDIGRGISGLWYGVLADTDIMVRGENLTDLRDQIRRLLGLSRSEPAA